MSVTGGESPRKILGEIHAWQWERRLLRKLAVEGYFHDSKAHYCFEGMQDFLHHFHVEQWPDDDDLHDSDFVYPWDSYDGASILAAERAREEVDLSYYTEKGLMVFGAKISAEHAAWRDRLVRELKRADDDKHFCDGTLTHVLGELGLPAPQKWRSVSMTLELDWVQQFPADADVPDQHVTQRAVEAQMAKLLPQWMHQLDATGTLVTEANVDHFQDLNLDVSPPNIEVGVEDE